MGLDITFVRRGNVACPHCGGEVPAKDLDAQYSCGRDWYSILEQIGYYVPFEERTEENDWYGKDMALNREQMELFVEFLKKDPDVYSVAEIFGLFCVAIVNKETVVINADW